MTDKEPIDKVVKPILRRLNSVSKDIEASAVMSRDGHSLSSVLGEGVDSDRLGAMCASMLSLAERTSSELKRGNLKQVVIEGDQGYVLVVNIGIKAVLAVVSRPSANLGMVFVEAKKIAKEIADAKVL